MLTFFKLYVNSMQLLQHNILQFHCALQKGPEHIREIPEFTAMQIFVMFRQSSQKMLSQSFLIDEDSTGFR